VSDYERKDKENKTKTTASKDLTEIQISKKDVHIPCVEVSKAKTL
jgi:hypothetical protein